MPRPKTKKELLHLSEANFQKLNDFIDQFSLEAQQLEFPAGTMNRDIRDVLAHLHAWHLLFQGWYEVGMQGNKPAIPAEGYTFKTTPALNRKIWEDYHTVPLAEIRPKLAASHRDLVALINSHTNDELFEKKRYKWTGSTSLGAYLISATSSHYDWAYKLIRKAKK
ncbi:MAG: ClbS/DfsB family four-helix bundle protein [Saprospiraceae bacterium]